MRIIALFIFFYCIVSLDAQVTVSGKVADSKTLEPLVGAYVISGQFNTVTDVDGGFLLEVQSLPVNITVSYLGYDDLEMVISIAKSNKIYLKTKNSVLDIMTVTASKYEKRLSEATVSVEVLKPDLISSINSKNIDEALEKVPGVQMIDGQANIRGGSGYSYGAGSRVMLLIDDMPALTVDAGFPNWSDIPVENIAQVEVVKGAASALYGSSALNGIINIRTGNATSTPQTSVSAGYTVFGDLPDTTQQWYGDTTRYQYNVSLLHKQKFGKLDVVASGFYTKLESFNRYTFQSRKRVNVKLQYQLADKVFVRLNSLINSGDNGNFFIWSSIEEGKRYEPYQGNPATSKNFRYFIDPSIHAEDKYGNTHKLLTRLHHVNNDNNNDQGNSSNTIYGEYQIQRNLKKYNLRTTAGILTQISNTDSELFGDTTFTSKNYAAYIQLDKRLFSKLNISTGLRYEYNVQLTPESFNGITVPDGKIAEGKLIGKAGLSYEYAPYSSLRASWGQGYRFPTITEKFITTTFAGFNILPNALLQSEFGWTGEVGVKQAYSWGGIKGYADLSYFISEYEDMTEFTIDLEDFLNIGFQSQNVGDTRITGVDFGLFMSADVGDVNMALYGGYTYLNPKYKNFEDSTLVASLSTPKNVLKYRVAHSTKWDAQLTYKGFSIGASVFYNSHMENIDGPIEALKLRLNNNEILEIDLFGIKEFREHHNSGYVKVDLRTSYTYKNTKLSFLINNVGNEEYTVRPGVMEAPTNYSLRLDYKIDWK